MVTKIEIGYDGWTESDESPVMAWRVGRCHGLGGL
jgi:hypothetical protein